MAIIVAGIVQIQIGFMNSEECGLSVKHWHDYNSGSQRSGTNCTECDTLLGLDDRMKLRQKGGPLAGDIFKCIFLYENCFSLMKFN